MSLRDRLRNCTFGSCIPATANAQLRQARVLGEERDFVAVG